MNSVWSSFIVLVLIWAIETKYSNKYNSTKTRIINGSKEDAVNFPFIVSIQERILKRPKEVYIHICGGSILSHNVILTAGHCVETYEGILPGTTYLKIHTGSTHKYKYGTYIFVEKVIIHPNINTSLSRWYGDTEYDVALLILKHDLPENYVKIKLPVDDRKLLPKNEKEIVLASTAGWGSIDAKDKTNESSTLLTTQVRLFSDAECQVLFKGRDLICAGPHGGFPCSADSGGPLVN